jgi:hypothetical protein
MAWREKPTEFVKTICNILPKEFVFENVASELPQALSLTVTREPKHRSAPSLNAVASLFVLARGSIC